LIVDNSFRIAISPDEQKVFLCLQEENILTLSQLRQKTNINISQLLQIIHSLSRRLMIEIREDSEPKLNKIKFDL
jgi:DNA-binding MarR family transcriptional regulator